MKDNQPEPTSHTLRAPGGLTVLVDGADRSAFDILVRQLNGQPTTGHATAELAVSIQEAAEDVHIDWASLSGATWRISGPAPSRTRMRILSALVRLRLLARGQMPIHGGAVVHGDRALVILGDAGSGKTKILMALLEAGWTFAAGEWLVIRSKTFESADDRVDLRARHLDELRRLRPRLDPQLRARRIVTRLPGTDRFDRFELSSAQLGVARARPGAVSPISEVVLSRSAGDDPRVSPCSLDEVAEELVASELARYRDLRTAYQRNAGSNHERIAVVDELRELLRRRIGENLADVPLRMIEHRPGTSLDELARLVGARQ